MRLSKIANGYNIHHALSPPITFSCQFKLLERSISLYSDFTFWKRIDDFDISVPLSPKCVARILEDILSQPASTPFGLALTDFLPDERLLCLQFDIFWFLLISLPSSVGKFLVSHACSFTFPFFLNLFSNSKLHHTIYCTNNGEIWIIFLIRKNFHCLVVFYLSKWQNKLTLVLKLLQVFNTCHSFTKSCLSSLQKDASRTQILKYPIHIPKN